jgi:hypothetical protein
MLKILESGAELNLTMCSFTEGNRLMKAVAQELKDVKLALGASGKAVDFLKLELGDDALNTVKNLVASLLASDSIEAALWPCIMRGTYNGVHITKETFEDEKVRADYIPVLKEALVFNLSPFFKSLVSLVKDIPAASIGIRKQSTV